MSFEFEPIQKAGSTRLEINHLVGLLTVLARNSPLTSTRKEHPSIDPFFNKRGPLALIERLVRGSEIASHPTEAFVVHTTFGVNKSVESGLAICMRNVEVFAKIPNESQIKLQKRYSVCMAWLSLGKPEQLTDVYTRIKEVSGEGNEIAIEPQSSNPIAHTVIASCFGGSVTGSFNLGEVRAPNQSVAYGLSAEDLTILPRL